MKFFCAIVCVLLLATLTSAVQFTETPDTLTIHTVLGGITGTKTRFGVEFLGIPYATAKRFEDSVPVSPWYSKGDGNIDAFKQGAACPQNCTLPDATCPPHISEDCLNINIFTPKFTSSSPQHSRRKPVMFFIHGGGYTSGYNGGILYDGKPITLGDVIVVAINYRLGAFGYYYNPQLGINGNFGLKDQLLGLQFVRAVIRDFGGDPDNITLIGQSAGASAVATLLTLPQTKNLVRNAMIASNPWTIPLREASADSTHIFSNALIEKSNCSMTTPDQTLDCLTKLDMNALVKISGEVAVDPTSALHGLIHVFLPWTPTVATADNFLPMQPFTAFTTGKIDEKISIILGSTYNESPPFINMAFDTAVSNLTYAIVAAGIFPTNKVGNILERFPGAPNDDNRPQLIRIANEWMFERSITHIAAQLVKHREAPEDKHRVSVYRFDHVFSDASIWGEKMGSYCGKTACHCADLPILFGAQNVRQANFTCTYEEILMSIEVQRQLWNFLYTGSPNTGPYPGVSTWASFYHSKGIYRQESKNFEMIDFEYYQDKQEFWDDVGYFF